MAEKKTLHNATAKAVARITGHASFKGAWGVAEHLAFIRGLVKDAMAEVPTRLPKLQEAEDKAAAEAKRPAKKLTPSDGVDRILRECFATDPEIAYASNLQKLLVKAGEIKSAGSEYESVD